MAGFFNDSKRKLEVEGFDEKKLRRFMDLGNKLAGSSTAQVDTLKPELESRRTNVRGDNRGLVTFGDDQLEGLLSVFKRRTENIGARRAQPGQSQSRLV